MFVGFPTSVGGDIGYDSEENSGAILLCDPITKEWAEQGKSRLKIWGSSIAEKIFNEEPETRDRGFLVVTGIHRSRRCLIHCWEEQNQSRSGSLRIETPLLPVGRAEVEGHLNGSSRNLGWHRCPADAEYLVITPCGLAELWLEPT